MLHLALLIYLLTAKHLRTQIHFLHEKMSKKVIIAIAFKKKIFNIIAFIYQALLLKIKSSLEV